jgi:hypothetical protein
MGASTLCVAHCVLTPVLLIALPIAGLSFLENELADRSLAVLAIGVAILALLPGYRVHGSKKLLGLTAFGVACLLFAAFGAEQIWGEAGDTGFTMLGGGTLALGHWLNRSFCKACRACRESSDCATG